MKAISRRPRHLTLAVATTLGLSLPGATVAQAVLEVVSVTAQ